MNNQEQAEHCIYPGETGEAEKRVKESIDRARVCGEQIILESFRSFSENGKVVGDAVKISLEDAECIAQGMNDYIEFMETLESKMREWHVQNEDKSINWVLEEAAAGHLEKHTSGAEMASPHEETSPDPTDTEANVNAETPEGALRSEVKKLEALLEEKKRQHQLIAERMRELELRRFISSRESEEKAAGHTEPNVVFRRLLTFPRLPQDAAVEPPHGRVSAGGRINCREERSLFNIHHLYVQDYERPSVNTTPTSKPQYYLYCPELLILDPQRREILLHHHRMNTGEQAPIFPRIVLCVAQCPSSAHGEIPAKLLLSIPNDQKLVFLLQKKWNAIVHSLSANQGGTINKFQYSCSSAFYDALVKFMEARKLGESPVSSLLSEVVDVSIQTKEGSVHEAAVNVAYKEFDGLYWLDFPFMQDLYEELSFNTEEGDGSIGKHFNLLHLLLSHMET
ncbi:hypothetical protein XU18_4747 [Perkinsela sp. CCAP 1560/4]|nr:hypothetical protein XU18_4747 [Perkinsela sp. CCAP 1560/4]|eukprot:KNH03939.1 hypothetical protein XU18_4747 [Perkinsela sp. CCAP 1560/4]